MDVLEVVLLSVLAGVVANALWTGLVAAIKRCQIGGLLRRRPTSLRSPKRLRRVRATQQLDLFSGSGILPPERDRAA